MHPSSRGFTINFGQTQRCIKTEAIVINSLETSKASQTEVIRDTGATCSAIDSELAESLGLKPVNCLPVNGVHGSQIVNYYLVDIVLPNEMRVDKVVVSSGSFGKSGGMLIGMDIISLGDFALCHKDGKTKFSFITPPYADIDFAKRYNEIHIKKSHGGVKKKRKKK